MDSVTNTYIYTNACANRLPCGVCRLLNAQCPIAYGGVTWDVTCQGHGMDINLSREEQQK